LKSNIDIQQELNNLRLAKDAIKVYGVKNKVAALHNEMMQEMGTNKVPKKGIVRSIVRRGMQIAASLFIVVVGVAVYQYSTVSSDKLFDANYLPYTVGVSRSVADVDVMEKSFQANNYADVLKQFVALSISNQKQNFLAGQSYYANAIVCFNKVLALNTAENKNIFKDDTEYYLALSYLKNNDFAMANEMFKSIYANKNHLYNDKISQKFMLQLKMLSWKN
jgi:tetratricopeptide (TPR) repeat protein